MLGFPGLCLRMEGDLSVFCVGSVFKLLSLVNVRSLWKVANRGSRHGLRWCLDEKGTGRIRREKRRVYKVLAEYIALRCVPGVFTPRLGIKESAQEGILDDDQGVEGSLSK